MFRKAVLWSLLATFSLLNVAGEALHQAVFLGSQLPSKADLRGDCSGHAHGHIHRHAHGHIHRHASRTAWLTTNLRQAGEQLPSRPSQWSQQETAKTSAAPHICCLLCQYNHQTKSSGQKLAVAVGATPQLTRTGLAKTSIRPTPLVSTWFARGPPVV